MSVRFRGERKVDAGAFGRYLRGVFSRPGMTDLELDCFHGGVSFTVVFKDRTLRVNMSLWESGDKRCLVVRDFKIRYTATVDLDTPFLSGEDFLQHYGKRLANDHDIGKPGGNVWVLRHAHDLQALFHSYNTTARDMGCVPLFE